MNDTQRPAGAPRPLRLVHVVTVPLSLQLLHGQLAFMKARGFEVHVVSSPGPLLDRCGQEHGVTTHAVEIPRQIDPRRDTRALLRLIRILREIEPDIVHSSTPKAGLLGTIAARLLGVPVRIYHMRGAVFPEATGAKRAVLRACERIACMGAHRVLFNSESTRRLFVDDGLCPRDKAAVLHQGSSNGVDAAGRFNPEAWDGPKRRALRAEMGLAADATVLGFVGRLVSDKGIAELAQAWLRLRLQFPELRLVLVGPTESETPLPGAVLATFQDDPRVIRVGHLSPAETARMYAVLDLVALPTYREGFPNVLLEAAAMALPVVATRVFGCVDAVVDGVTGTLVEARDAAALAGAIERYLRDPGLRRTHGDAARARVLRDFVPADIWAASHDHYRELLAAAGYPAHPS